MLQSSINTCASIKGEYEDHIKIATLEIMPITVFIGVDIERDRKACTTTITQATYISKLEKQFAESSSSAIRRSQLVVVLSDVI